MRRKADVALAADAERPLPSSVHPIKVAHLKVIVERPAVNSQPLHRILATDDMDEIVIHFVPSVQDVDRPIHVRLDYIGIHFQDSSYRNFSLHLHRCFLSDGVLPFPPFIVGHIPVNNGE